MRRIVTEKKTQERRTKKAHPAASREGRRGLQLHHTPSSRHSFFFVEQFVFAFFVVRKNIAGLVGPAVGDSATTALRSRLELELRRVSFQLKCSPQAHARNTFHTATTTMYAVRLRESHREKPDLPRRLGPMSGLCSFSVRVTKTLWSE